MPVPAGPRLACLARGRLLQDPARDRIEYDETRGARWTS